MKDSCLYSVCHLNLLQPFLDLADVRCGICHVATCDTFTLEINVPLSIGTGLRIDQALAVSDPAKHLSTKQRVFGCSAMSHRETRFCLIHKNLLRDNPEAGTR